MVFVCNLRNIHSLANVVILFVIKKLANLVIISNQWLAFTRTSATRIKTRVSGLPMIKQERFVDWHVIRFCPKKLNFDTNYITIIYIPPRFSTLVSSLYTSLDEDTSLPSPKKRQISHV